MFFFDLFFDAKPASGVDDWNIHKVFPTLYVVFGLVLMVVVFLKIKRARKPQRVEVVQEERPRLRRYQRLINQRAAAAAGN